MNRAVQLAAALVAGLCLCALEAEPYLVKDINLSSAGSSSPASLTAAGARLFFTADDGAFGRELWATDGTPEGTALVKDIDPGAGGSIPAALTPVRDRLFFIAEGDAGAWGLWVSGGTAESTVFLHALKRPPDADGTYTPILTAAGDRLYFTDDWDDRRSELWVSDGTLEGTSFVRYITSGAPVSYYSRPVALGDYLIFVAEDQEDQGALVRELWITDGTQEGSMLLKRGRGPFDQLTAVGDRIFFKGADEEQGWGLWVSDGTPVGTVFLKEFGPGPGGEFPAMLTAAGNRLFFMTGDLMFGRRDLWVSDGTPGGTVLVRAVETDTRRNGLIAVGDRVFFNAFRREAEDRSSWALWLSDGTPEGTVLVRAMEMGRRPGGFIASDDRLFLTSFKGGTEDLDPAFDLWTSDGTPQGTSRIRDLGYWPCDPWAQSRCSEPTLYHHLDRLFFTSQDACYGIELWALPLEEAPIFRRGDANADGKMDIGDGIAALGFLFLGSPEKLPCQKGADADDSGGLDISDGVFILNNLYLGGPPPPEPFQACGGDPTPDTLPCDSFVSCQ